MVAKHEKRGGLTRRQTLAGTAATLGLALAFGKAGNARAGEAVRPESRICVLTPEATQGPFYFDPKLVRADVTEGRPGSPLALSLQVVEAGSCAALKGARVDTPTRSASTPAMLR